MPFQVNSYHTWNACKDDYTSDEAEDQAYMQKYGLDYCFPGNDYFAKAAETCGGTSKMAQMSDLATIANHIYGRTDIGEETNKSGLSISVDPTSLGFPSPSFWVWSGEEYSSFKSHAYTRNFNSGNTVWNGLNRVSSDGWAVCLGD